MGTNRKIKVKTFKQYITEATIDNMEIYKPISTGAVIVKTKNDILERYKYKFIYFRIAPKRYIFRYRQQSADSPWEKINYIKIFTREELLKNSKFGNFYDYDETKYYKYEEMTYPEFEKWFTIENI